MENTQLLKFKWDKGKKQVFPAHSMVKNWLFTEDTEDEAILANSMATIAEKSGVSINELQYMFPMVLRMLKNDSEWSR